MMATIRKAQLEASLHKEKKLIEDGRLKDENPLDLSEKFSALCEACRRGDLKTCQEIVVNGVNINARDRFDYTPLILASLCGHYEVVQYLLESGALCKRDTFQGERCLYNALNDRIRKLLLSYDYHKSADPLQPFASHITSLLTRNFPRTSDIVVKSANESFHLHKFILSSRCPYFSRKFAKSPDVKSWELPWMIPSQAVSIAMRHIYLDDIPTDVGGGPKTGSPENEILKGVYKVSKQLEIPSLLDNILESNDPKLAGQLKREEVEKGQDQLHDWFRENMLKQKVFIDTAKVDSVKWDSNNAVFADVLLRADEPENAAVLEDGPEDIAALENAPNDIRTEHASDLLNGRVSTRPSSNPSRSSSRNRPRTKSVLFPVHRAMLIRSEFFLTMFSSPFREAQPSAHLQIIPVDCKPEVLEIVLTFLYTEKSDFPLEHAIDVLFAADLLLIEKLKVRAAVVISTLGNGSMRANHTGVELGAEDHEVINIYDVLRAGWLTRVPRLEEFAARYFAYRLETYIEEEEFAEVIQESAGRIQGRQETDSIELLDEIRFYLSERFRLRFEDAGLEHLLDETPNTTTTESIPQSESQTPPSFSSSSSSSSSSSIKTTEVGARAEAEAGAGFGAGPTTAGTATAGAVIMRTLDGEAAGDEFAREAADYQMLLGKIDTLLEKLGLGA